MSFEVVASKVWYISQIVNIILLMFQRLRSGKHYPESVVSILNGEMQSRSVRLGDNPNMHPNYFKSAPYESPAQTRQAINGAFTLRLLGHLGLPEGQVWEMANSDEVVGNLYGMDFQPVSLRRLNIVKTMPQLFDSNMVEMRTNGKIAPSFALARLMINNPDQAYTVYPTVSRPSYRQSIDVYYQYHHPDASQVG